MDHVVGALWEAALRLLLLRAAQRGAGRRRALAAEALLGDLGRVKRAHGAVVEREPRALLPLASSLSRAETLWRIASHAALRRATARRESRDGRAGEPFDAFHLDVCGSGREESDVKKCAAPSKS